VTTDRYRRAAARRALVIKVMAVLIVVTFVAALLAGCGIPTQDEFVAMSPSDAPFAIETTVPTETTDESNEAAAPSAIYLVDAGNLLMAHPVDDPGSISGALDLLDSGEVAGDAALRSAVPPGGIVAVTVTGRSLVGVDLDPAFVELPADEQLLAIAQIVLTATDTARSMLVGFSIDGEPIEVPRGDSSVGGGAVTRRDYENLLAP
jgi:hypothetical protein